MCQSATQKGIMIDILDEIFPATQYKVKVTFEPIMRAFQEITSGKYDGFLGGNQIQLKENIFPKFVTVPNPTYFYKLKGSKWNYKNLDSLRNESFVVVRAFIYPNTEINDYIKRNEFKNIQYINNLEHLPRMISLIKRKRYTSFLAGEIATEYYFKKSVLKNNIISDPKEIGIFNNSISIYPSGKKSQVLLKHIDSEFLKIYKSGKLQEIYKSYGITRKIKLIKNPPKS